MYPVNAQIYFCKEDRLNNYRPRREASEGYVFTGVCHSLCLQGGICLLNASAFMALREGKPLSCEQTDACEDNTFPQLRLRAVIKKYHPRPLIRH